MTAEAISEALKRPLYYVSMGELGTTPDELEKRLSDILDLCSVWNALVLFDEADVFLEKRTNSDVMRNSMVCVMLRLLEYHQGIMFLTTNRIREFDPAFESRVTVALKYENLDPASREKVWKNLISKMKVPIKDDIDYKELGSFELNGRQIKNAVRLSLALSQDANVPFSMDFIKRTISVMSIGRNEMATATNF